MSTAGEATARDDQGDVIIEHFDGTTRRAQVVLSSTFALMAVGLLVLALLVPSDQSATVRLWVSVPMSLLLAVVGWVFARMRFELRTFPGGFAARVRPSRWVRIESSEVVLAELVEVSPFWEYGGWIDKRNFGDRLLGGCGRTALRTTYVVRNGKQDGSDKPKTRRLTLLTGEAERLLAHVHPADAGDSSG